MIIKNISDLIGNTPLFDLEKIKSNPKGARLLGKMEFLNPGGSIKDRPCLEMIKEAEMQGVLREGSTIIEPTTGNTGIGLAMICAERGYRCILTMPEDLSLERIYMLRNYGAEVILTPAKKGVAGSIDKAYELLKKIDNSFMPLQFKSQANPASHRKTTAQEILSSLNGNVDAFVSGVGTGGTITGIGEVLKQKNNAVRIVAVEPQNCAVLSGGRPGRHKIQGIGAGFIPEILNRDIIDEYRTVTDEEAFKMARLIGIECGLCVGISSGANVKVALDIAAQMKEDQTVVTILCDTGERYFSTTQYFEA